MGAGEAKAVPPRKPVPAGKTRLCEAGYTASPHTGRARQIIGYIASKYSSEYESWFYFDSGDKYFAFLHHMFDNVTFPQHLKGHATSPFVWTETGNNEISQLIGGRADLVTWAKAKFPNDKDLMELCAHWHFSDTFHDKPTSAQSTADVKVEETKAAEATKTEQKTVEQSGKLLLFGDKFPTRTHRVSWMLYELETDFDFQEMTVAGEGSSPEFLAKFPALKTDPLFHGTIPAIVDGSLALTESTVIVTYLADKHKKFIPAPGSPERLRFDELVSFVATELEPPVYSMFLHSFILPDAVQVPQVIPFEKQRATAAVTRLEQLLKDSGSEFIFGSSFSALDVIAGYWITNLHRAQPLTETHPLVAKYAERLAARKAFKQSVERIGSFL